MSSKPGTVPAPAPSPQARIHGCLLGGALGDSLGYAVARDDITAIRARFGPGGLQDPAAAEGGSTFSYRTQLTLYTVDGLVEALEWANSGVGADTNACLWLAYLRWLGTQGVPLPAAAPVQPPRWIDTQEALRHRRDPDPDSLSGLATGEMGTLFRPVNPEAKGAGTVARSAPFGLIPNIGPESVYKLSSDAAALTHGHPAARQGAGALSLMIHFLAAGHGLPEAAGRALAHLREAALGRNESPDPVLTGRLEAALRLAPAGRTAAAPGPEDLVRELGEGQGAEEALAVALYAVLATVPETAAPGHPQAHFRAAMAAAVNHSADSTAAAAVAGNLLGAFYGEECLPAAWLEALDAPEVIRGMASRLAVLTSA